MGCALGFLSLIQAQCKAGGAGSGLGHENPYLSPVSLQEFLSSGF